MGPFLTGAIIAAGRGERLRAASGGLPKPLVAVGRATLLEHQIAALLEVGVARVHVIVNSETARLIKQRSVHLPEQVDLCVADTANSMESLLTLGPRIAPDRFLLMTVDAVLPAKEWHFFVEWASVTLDPPEGVGCDGVLGITRWRGDARALFVEIEPGRVWVTRLSDDPAESVTAGVYAFRTKIFDYAEMAKQRRFEALRRYLSLLVEQRLKIAAIQLQKVIDIDEPGDLELARAAMGLSLSSGKIR